MCVLLLVLLCLLNVSLVGGVRCMIVLLVVLVVLMKYSLFSIVLCLKWVFSVV